MRRAVRRGADFVWAIGPAALYCAAFRNSRLTGAAMTTSENRLDSCPIRRRRCRHVAHAGAGDRHGLPDHADRLRSAFDAGLFPDAAVERQSLGPRRLRVRARVAKSAVGHRPAARRHDRRPLRHHPRGLRRRDALCGRPGADVARDQRAAARCLGRRADRFRPCRLLVPGHSRGLRQAVAAGMPLDRVRLRHRGGLVRAIPLFAARRRADGHVRLAADAHHLRRQHAGRAAAVAGSGHADDDVDDGGGVDAIAPAGARRSLRPSLLHAAGARLLHLRLPARIHHRAFAGLSGRPRAVGAGRRLDHRHHRAVQHHRLGHRRLARRPHAEALSALVHLFRPRRGDPRVHLVPGHDGRLPDLRRDHGPDVALHRAADQRHHRADVRHPLAGDACRASPSSATRSAASSASGSAASCSTAPARTTWCGGSRSCSACSRR